MAFLKPELDYAIWLQGAPPIRAPLAPRPRGPLLPKLLAESWKRAHLLRSRDDLAQRVQFRIWRSKAGLSQPAQHREASIFLPKITMCRVR